MYTVEGYVPSRSWGIIRVKRGQTVTSGDDTCQSQLIPGIKNSPKNISHYGSSFQRSKTKYKATKQSIKPLSQCLLRNIRQKLDGQTLICNH